jgi:hypothetical protein
MLAASRWWWQASRNDVGFPRTQRDAAGHAGRSGRLLPALLADALGPWPFLGGQLSLRHSAHQCWRIVPPRPYWGWYILLGTGFCGGFTTFSTFEWETLQMVRQGHWWLALIYVLGSVAAGFLGVMLAVFLVDSLSPGE